MSAVRIVTSTASSQLQVRVRGVIALLAPGERIFTDARTAQLIGFKYRGRVKITDGGENVDLDPRFHPPKRFNDYSDAEFRFKKADPGWEEMWSRPLTPGDPSEFYAVDRPSKTAIRAVTKELDRKLKLGWRIRGGKLVQPTLWRRFINWLSY